MTFPVRKEWLFEALWSCFVVAGVCGSTHGGEFLIGTGSYDMTGPAAQINFMGYARMDQNAEGIHQRLRARAFLISDYDSSKEQDLESVDKIEISRSRLGMSSMDKEDGLRRRSLPLIVKPGVDPEKTICFVSIDAGMGSDILNMRVLDRLEELLPAVDTRGSKRLCHLENLSISGTHTHSSPAGFLQYTLYQITSLGFSEEVIKAYTEGIAQAILKAYNNLQPGTIDMAEDLLFEANMNRSPSSYLLNPEEERREYALEGDTDKTMLQLSFKASATGKKVGLLNWFAVHGTSMNATNRLISGDNKGYASYLAERYWNGNDTITGTGSFVAAFASTNLGDVSPNTAGPRCIDTGLPCDVESTCDGGSPMLCIASGPGKDMFESTEIIGRKQYDHSLRMLLEEPRESLRGEVAHRHSFVDMSKLKITLDSGDVVHTCPAALGYGFAGGTTDGPGQFPFHQMTNTSNPFFNMVAGFLSVPSQEQIDCQAPKPILLNTGQASLPYDWDPNTVPISIFRVGRLFILNVPAELTTMAGRRLRKAVKTVLAEGGATDSAVTIAGLANSYTHYVTTFEEYGGQRYEAASTLYGPHTLSAYIQEFKRIASDIITDSPSATVKGPKDLSKKQLSLIPSVPVDVIGLGREFGSIAIDTRDQYRIGETVFVSFRSANPRNNLRIGDTFLTVDVLDDDGHWQTRYVDSDWCTKFHWKGGASHWDTSFAEISWDIGVDTPRGLYRICHYGTRKTLLGAIEVALYYTPAWLTSNVLGSYALNLALQSVKFAVHFSGVMRSYVGGIMAFSQTKEFSGCTRAFLVH